MTTSEYFHGTPPELYDRLVALFGEQTPSDPRSDARWVVVGAGSVALTFFPARVYDQAAVEAEVA